MTREERIHAVACAMVRVLRPGLRECYVADEARGNQTTRYLAEVELDAADATREPCDAEARIKAAREAFRLRFKQGPAAALSAMAEALGFSTTVQM